MNRPLSRTVVRSDAATAGIGLGSALAVAISWSLHKSIVWASIHGVFSWLYVLYYAFTRPGGLSA